MNCIELKAAYSFEKHPEFALSCGKSDVTQSGKRGKRVSNGKSYNCRSGSVAPGAFAILFKSHIKVLWNGVWI